MTARRIAAILGALAVACGAFGAHTLREQVDADHLEWWKTGALYHLIHAAAALASGREDGRPSAATWAFVAGVALFSGSLYAMTLGAPRVLGAVTPVGGLAFIAGWVLLGFAKTAGSKSA